MLLCYNLISVFFCVCLFVFSKKKKKKEVHDTDGHNRLPFLFLKILPIIRIVLRKLINYVDSQLVLLVIQIYNQNNLLLVNNINIIHEMPTVLSFHNKCHLRYAFLTSNHLYLGLAMLLKYYFNGDLAYFQHFFN